VNSEPFSGADFAVDRLLTPRNTIGAIPLCQLNIDWKMSLLFNSVLKRGQGGGGWGGGREPPWQSYSGCPVDSPASPVSSAKLWPFKYLQEPSPDLRII